MNWKRLTAILFAVIVIYYMTKFTLAHLKEGGMVWWGGWIAVGFVAISALLIIRLLKGAAFQSGALNQCARVLRVVTVLFLIFFMWEALIRGLPVSSEIFSAPSVLWGNLFG